MPQKMTLQQFGQTIKAKYPDYASKSDEEIGQAMLAKYPEYQERVDSGSPAGTLAYKQETARQRFEANKPVPTAGTVGQSIGEGMVNSLKGAATGLAGLSAHVLSGNAGATIEDVANLPGGIYHGAVDPVLNYVKALREKDPNAAGEAAGGIITGTLPAIYGAVEAAPSAIRGAAKLGGVTSDSLMLRAAQNRVPLPPSQVGLSDVVAPALGAGAEMLSGGNPMTGAMLGEGANLARRAMRQPARNMKAWTQERLAKVLAQKDTAPTIPNQPDQFQGTLGVPPETPPMQVGGLSSRPIRQAENVPPNLPTERGAIPGQRPEMAINQARPASPETQLAPPTEATFQSPAGPSTGVEMANPPAIDAQLSKAKELRNFAYGGDPAVANIEQGIAPSGREAQASTLRIAPKLAEDPILAKAKGLRFDQELFNKFKSGEAEVSAAEQSIPRSTSVPQQPITDGLEAIIQKYIELGEPEAAGAIRNEWRKWSEKESIIPWDDFLARKRQLGKNIQTTGGWRETGTAADKAKAAALREAYGVLMDSTSQLSERLQKANSAYSTIRDALDDAGMDLRTGRRFARVGKEPPPAPFGQQ